MLDTFKTVNPNVKFILAYPPPAFEVQWGIRDSVIVNGVMPVVSALIEKNKTYSVNFYEPLLQSPLLFPDAIHPNAQGAQEMANILFDVLIETGLVK